MERFYYKFVTEITESASIVHLYCMSFTKSSDKGDCQNWLVFEVSEDKFKNLNSNKNECPGVDEIHTKNAVRAADIPG